MILSFAEVILVYTQKPKFYLIAEIALPDAEYIIVNYFVDSLLSRLFHLYALLVCVEYVWWWTVKLFFAWFLNSTLIFKLGEKGLPLDRNQLLAAKSSLRR